jgi:hypothetical protein
MPRPTPKFRLLNSGRMNYLALHLGARASAMVNAVIEVPGAQANKYEYGMNVNDAARRSASEVARFSRFVLCVFSAFIAPRRLILAPRRCSVIPIRLRLH